MRLRTGKAAIQRFAESTLESFFTVDVIHGFTDDIFARQVIGTQKGIVDGLINASLIDESHEIGRRGNYLLVPPERLESTFSLRNIGDGCLNRRLPLPCQRSDHDFQCNHRVIDAPCVELVTVENGITLGMGFGVASQPCTLISREMMLQCFECKHLVAAGVSEHVGKSLIRVEWHPGPVNEYALDRSVDQIPKASLTVS